MISIKIMIMNFIHQKTPIPILKQFGYTGMTTITFLALCHDA